MSHFSDHMFSDHMPVSEFAVIVPDILGRQSARVARTGQGVTLRRTALYPTQLGDHVQLVVSELHLIRRSAFQPDRIGLILGSVGYGMGLIGYDRPEENLRAIARNLITRGKHTSLEYTLIAEGFNAVHPVYREPNHDDAAIFNTAMKLASTVPIEVLAA